MFLTILQFTEHRCTHQSSPPLPPSPPSPPSHRCHPLPTKKWMGWSFILFAKLTTKYASRHHAQSSKCSISLNSSNNPLRQVLFSSSCRMKKQKLGELNIAQSHTADICIQYKSHSACTEMHLEKFMVTDRRVGSAYSNFQCSCNRKDPMPQLSNIPSHQTQPPNSDVPRSYWKW